MSHNIERNKKMIFMEWKCIAGCNAECCGIVPIPIQKYNIFRRKIKKKIVDTLRFGSHIVLMTKDGSCAFLDNRKCSIYNNRPVICRLYGTVEKLRCPYIDINGCKRTEEEIVETKESIHNQIDDRINMVISEKVQK